MIKRNIWKLVLFICVIVTIAMFVLGTYTLNEYVKLQEKYNNLLNQPPEVEVVVEKEYIEKEVEITKEVPVYTEAEALSEEDFFLLCQLIYREAGSSRTSNLDRTLAGNVALNRLACNYMKADTLKEVIYSKGQYSTASAISSNEHIKIPMSSVLAAYRLAIGNRYCPNNVVYQSQHKQGDGVWKKVNHHYYCYESSIEVDENQVIKEFVD